MTLILVFFITVVVLLIGLLLWAIRPLKVRFRSADEVFEALAGPRHYYRLPQILLALQAKDIEFLKERGHPELHRRVRYRAQTNRAEFLGIHRDGLQNVD